MTSAGQLLNGNMADYLVPMAAEMPDIEVGHVVTPTADCELGAKGAGEAGTAGAPACVMNAVNDALAPARRSADHRNADHADGRAQGARQGLVDVSGRAEPGPSTGRAITPAVDGCGLPRFGSAPDDAQA